MGLKNVFCCSVAENSLELLHPVFLYALCDPSLPPNLPMACRQHVWMLLLKTSFHYETKDFLLKMLSWLQVSIFHLLRNMGYNFKLQYFLGACGTNVRKQIFLFTIPYCRNMFNCHHCMQCYTICQLHLHISSHPHIYVSNYLIWCVMSYKSQDTYSLFFILSPSLNYWCCCLHKCLDHVRHCQ